jgi:hypothetical protein
MAGTLPVGFGAAPDAVHRALAFVRRHEERVSEEVTP